LTGRVLLLGGLGAYLAARILLSQTLPSSVFLSEGRKLQPLAVTGAHSMSVRGRVLQIVELRGWLRAVDATCYSHDPAWYYLLEPDLAWTDSAGISMADIFRVGNIAALGDRRQETSANEVVSRPLIRIEFGGWDARRRNQPPPNDWRYAGAPGCPDVHFAFDPLRPVPSGPPLVPGRYVRVVGSFVSDVPHATMAHVGVWLYRYLGIALKPEHRVYAVQNSWSNGREEDPANPARWTEIHPPDRIEPLPDGATTETVRGVAIRVPDGILRDSARPLNLTLSPPAARPVEARGIRVAERVLAVSAKSDFDRAVAASQLWTDGERVHLRIDPQAAGLESFAAIYRVSWSRDGNSWTVLRPRGLAGTPGRK
jgi:hypothetical protein